MGFMRSAKRNGQQEGCVAWSRNGERALTCALQMLLCSPDDYVIVEMLPGNPGAQRYCCECATPGHNWLGSCMSKERMARFPPGRQKDVGGFERVFCFRHTIQLVR